MIRARLFLCVPLAGAASAQTRPANPPLPSPPPPPNQLTAEERAAGWRLLFDGRTPPGWRGPGYDSVPSAPSGVVDGAIKKIARGNAPKLPDGQPRQGG